MNARQKHQSVVPARAQPGDCTHPDQRWNPQPKCVPWLGMEPSLSVTGRRSNRATPAWAQIQ